jgi:hypothetical protein
MKLCDGCIGALDDEKDAAIYMVKALDFSNEWIEYQKDIEKARLAIDKVCDAVPIKATGAPRPPPTESFQGWQHDRRDFGARGNEQPGWSNPMKMIKSATSQLHFGLLGSAVNNSLNALDAALLGSDYCMVDPPTPDYYRNEGSGTSRYNGAGDPHRDRGHALSQSTEYEGSRQMHNAYDQFNSFHVPGGYPHV